MRVATFSDALIELKNGARVARAGWNGKGMYLYLFIPNDDAGKRIPNHPPYVVMKTADDMHVPWLCSQTDMLAEDWEVVS